MMRFLFILLLSFPAQAADILFHGPSTHLGGGYKNDNYGIGYAFDNRAVVGTYANSIGRRTVYAGYFFPIVDNLSVLAGAATGYEYGGVRYLLVPAVVLSYRIPITGRWAARVNVVPFGYGVINLALSLTI